MKELIMCAKCRANTQLAKQMLKAVEYSDVPATADDVWYEETDHETAQLYVRHAVDVIEGLTAAGFEIQEV
jgi:hypothetical protein